jgi:Tfp pilus assembly protein PilO
MSRTTQILLVVGVTAAAIAAYWYLALAPKRDEIAKLDADIATQQTEVEQARQQLATYEAARKSYKRNYATLARLGKAVPADDDVRSLMVQIEASAGGTGVDFQRIELGTGLAGADSGATKNVPTEGELASAPGAIPVAGGVLSAMPFSFTFTGGYFDLQNFFAKLEHFVTLNNAKLDATGRLLRLETLSITPADSGYPDMQAQVGAATYIVPPVEAVPSAGGATPGSTQNASTPPSSPGSTTPTTTATAGAAQ